MLIKYEETFTGGGVPNPGRAIETAGDKFIAIGVETQRDDLALVALEPVDLQAGLDIPENAGVVHTAGGQQIALRLELETHDLEIVAFQSGQTFAGVAVPDLGGLVETAGRYSVSERVVKRDTVHHVFVALQRENLLSRLGLPHLACSIVATSYEVVSVLVEGAISQRQYMSF